MNIKIRIKWQDRKAQKVKRKLMTQNRISQKVRAKINHLPRLIRNKKKERTPNLSQRNKLIKTNQRNP